ncbi:heme/copper-type cytochrome/quinol oxidase, subunit 2 [Rivularia sp. PCC 7116]|uniref:cytochrome c oxidase subunit II n=1 Tax=Rivularia sp. PCC 7116 TaxID=373994 RepID=UPI00029EC86A|nr:cytochrome c oxidase subunit II [Rivularia sp. PCC 7116]AFY55715.1 heme/copper-type cytochrome/quinol oxidase, subunit 2 [Rivularia sp. PCC 7116]
MTRRKIILLAIATIFLAIVSLGIGQLSYTWLPPEATAESLLVDDLFSFLVTLGAFIFLGVTGALIYSIIFNRAGKYDISDGPHVEGNITLEVVWTAIPFVLVIWIGVYSYQIYDQMSILSPMEHQHTSIGMKSANAAPISTNSELPKDSEKIEVISKQWAWIFNYPEQNISSTELHLPVNQRAYLTLKSEDVIHGFYIPAFRVKQDVIPNETINFEFTPILEGKYRLRDSQYSGTYFAAMQADVVVESPEKYNQWLKEASKQKPSPAYNQAMSEYKRKSEQAIDTNWATVKPAEPPVVNYHD